MNKEICSQHSNVNNAHNQVVDNQFGSQAQQYLTSSVHASGQEFSVIEDVVRQFNEPKVLYVGCGAGHVSFYTAPIAQKVTAYDLSDDMLQVVKQTAFQKELDNITIAKGVAESLPFDDNSFDVVISRFSAHHWQDVSLALREIRRVCHHDGLIIIVDIMAPAHPLCDTFLQTMELLRDNSHVRDYSLVEWQTMLSQAGLNVSTLQTHKLLLEFKSWVTRMRTPDHYIKAIRALQISIGQEARDYFEVQYDGSFTTDVMTLIASTK